MNKATSVVYQHPLINVTHAGEVMATGLQRSASYRRQDARIWCRRSALFMPDDISDELAQQPDAMTCKIGACAPKNTGAYRFNKGQDRL